MASTLGLEGMERLLADPRRLRELAELDLRDGLPDDVFDQIARMAARLLDVPIALVSFVDDHRQFIKGSAGELPASLTASRELGVDGSLCRYVVSSGRPLVVDDARLDPTPRTAPTSPSLGVAYAGVPLRGPDGAVLGSLCAISPVARTWTAKDVATLEDLAVLADMSIAYRGETVAIARDRLRLSAILDNAAEGVLGVDGDGVVTFANRAAERLLRRPLTELIGREAHSLLHGTDGNGLRCGEQCVDDLLVRSGRTVSRETTIGRGDGTTFPARYTSAAKRDGTTARGVVLLFSDRTNEVALEHRTAEFAERLRAIFEHSPDAMLLTIPDGSILEANDAACEMFGRSIDELRRLGRGAVVDVTDPRLPELLARRAQQGHASGAMRMRRHDGTTFEAEVSSTLFHDREGRVLSSMSIRDVSERVRLETELRHAAARLAERVDAELQFEAILGHELRTPLVAMGSFAGLLRRGSMPIERARELAAYLERDAARAERLLDQLLELDRVESGRAPLLIEPVPLNDMLAQIVATLSSSTSRHSIELRCEEAVSVLGDRDRLVQLFTNLVENAIKYSPGGGVIEVEVEHASGRAIVRVRDHGLGIPPDDLERIFQKHHRAEIARRPDIKGSGLGLQLARAIVEQHGGRIWAASDGEGRGATFSVALTEAL